MAVFRSSTSIPEWTLCYCYVCQVPSSQCSEWETHCKANADDKEWQKVRAEYVKPDNMQIVQLRTSLLYADQRKAIQYIYPKELNAGTSISLHAGQRQMLAFAIDNEINGASNRLFVSNSDDDALPPLIYGGMIAAETGVGKTGVIIGLLLLRRLLTLVVVPPGAVTQWKTEVQRFAPSLRCCALYANPQSQVAANIDSYDVVIIGSTSKLHDEIKAKVRRVVVDESHLVLDGKKCSKVTSFLRHLPRNVAHTWLLSATPFVEFHDAILRRQFQCFFAHDRFRLSSQAKIADARRLIIRVAKNQKMASDGVVREMVKVPEVEIDTIVVKLSQDERKLYDFAACIDGWSGDFRLTSSDRGNQLLQKLETRFYMRQLVLGERIREFEAEARRRMHQLYAPDSMPLHKFRCIVERMTHQLDIIVARVEANSSKIDAVLDIVRAKTAQNSDYKAIIVTESFGAGEYVKRTFDSVGLMQRKKGETQVHAQKVLREFQEGKLSLLVCCFENVEIGINLQVACQMFFIDTCVNDTKHQQACGRLSRCGVKHSSIKASFVYVDNTLSEKIYRYHEERRSGKTCDSAAALFFPDSVHSFEAPADTYRVEPKAYDQSNISVSVLNPNTVKVHCKSLPAYADIANVQLSLQEKKDGQTRIVRARFKLQEGDNTVPNTLPPSFRSF